MEYFETRRLIIKAAYKIEFCVAPVSLSLNSNDSSLLGLHMNPNERFGETCFRHISNLRRPSLMYFP